MVLALREMMAGRKEEWTGTANDLLKHLVEQVGESATHDKTWPKTAYG